MSGGVSQSRSWSVRDGRYPDLQLTGAKDLIRAGRSIKVAGSRKAAKRAASA
jgi:hypothetical protein